MTGQTAWSQGSGINIDDNAGAGDLYTTFSADRIMSLVVAASYGIRYSVALIDDLFGLTEMQALDLAVVNENRWVYRYDGVIWKMFFQLDAVHNHDDAYLAKTGTAVNSNQLAGKILSDSFSTNTVVSRTGTGDIYANKFHSSWPNIDTPPSNTVSIGFRIDESNNTELQFMTKSAFSNWCQNSLVKTFDSMRLGGMSPSQGASPDTIVSRTNYGDINARLFRSTYAEQTGAPATTTDIAFRTNASSDNYIRFMSNSAFSSWCQVAAIKTYDSIRLGGLSPSSYLRSDTSDTFTGTLVLAGTLYINDSLTRIYEGVN